LEEGPQKRQRHKAASPWDRFVHGRHSISKNPVYISAAILGCCSYVEMVSCWWLAGNIPNGKPEAFQLQIYDSGWKPLETEQGSTPLSVINDRLAFYLVPRFFITASKNRQKSRHAPVVYYVDAWPNR